MSGRHKHHSDHRGSHAAWTLTRRTRQPILSVFMWLCLVFPGITSFAENSVVIPDLLRQSPGSTVQVPVFLTNDVEIRQLIVPLVFRHQDADRTFFTAAKATFRDRLPPTEAGGALIDGQFTNRYDDEDGMCKEGSAGGFGTITYLKDTTSHPVAGAPLAFLMVRFRITGANLLPGTDATGSIVFTLTLNEEPGCFYIDTTCTNPYNHLDFQANDNTHIVPTFRSGLVCIDTSCSCPHQSDLNGDGPLDALDLGFLIDVLFAGAPDVRDPSCPLPRSDFDCDGYPTSLDLGGLISHLFEGGAGPCDPCVP